MKNIKKFPFTFTYPKDNFIRKATVSPVYQDLKIDDVPNVLIYQHGNILIRKQSKKIDYYTFFDYYDEYFKDTFIEKETNPFLICFCDGAFTNLDFINYDLEIVDYLNEQGLHIYVWEMAVLSLSKKNLSHWPIKVEPGDNVEDIFNENKDSIVGFESTEDNLKNLRCLDFDCINKFVERNKLTNVTVFTGNYQNEKYFSKNYPRLKFGVKDLATASMLNHTTDEKFNSYTYNPNLTIPDSASIDYKFWSGNKRYSGQRNIIAAYLLGRSSLVSFSSTSIDFLFNCPSIPAEVNFWSNINNKLWFDLDQWRNNYPNIYKKLKTGLNYIDEVQHLHIDRDIADTETDFVHNIIVPAEYYHTCFCAVVTETIFAQPCGHYAEKTLNAIKCFRPFILAAPPRTLEFLRKCGVKTFSDYWDESYDLEENHERRLVKILELIDYIDSMSIFELKDMYDDMKPILEHNYKAINSLKYQNYGNHQ